MSTHAQLQIDIQHVNVKLLLDDPGSVRLAGVVPVFHSWIQDQIFDGLLLDVADYSHLPGGPGVVLIGNEGDISLDNADERLGVRYNRKSPLSGTNQERLRQACLAALLACQRLENEPSLGRSIRFGGQEIEFFINDRLLAPNREETRAACLPEFLAFFETLLGGQKYNVSFNTDPRRLLTVFLKMQGPVQIESLISNLSR